MADIKSVVQTQDFPQPTGRLQELFRQYNDQNGIPELTLEGENDLSQVQVVNEVKIRRFGSLKQKEKEKVLKRIDGIDYMVSNDIQTFGSAKGSTMTKQAELIISKYTSSEVGEISEPMTDLVATLRSNNPNQIVKKVSGDTDRKEWGIFSSIFEAFAMKDAKKKMFKALAEHDTIMHNIQTILSELKKEQINLRKDIRVYEQMERGTYNQISEFEYDCIALDLMIEDATKRLNALIAKGTLDLTEMNEANQLKSAIDRMQRRKYTIQTIRTSTVQTLPQLSVLIYGNEIICEKIDEIESMVVPLWTWQYAIAVGAVKQQEALSIQKTIRGITSKLLTGNAKMLHDNMIAAQEELHAAGVAVEDLLIVQNYIADMVSKVDEIRQQASKSYVDGLKTMQEIEKQNYRLMSQNVTSQ